MKTTNIDWEVIEQLKALGQTFQTVLEIYEQGLPEKLKNLELAIHSRDIQKTLAHVHALLSSSSYLGALRVKEICEQMRKHLDKPDWKSVEDLSKGLVEECHQVIALLKSS